MAEAIRAALERLRMGALGNDYANEYQVRQDYELLDDAIDALERLEDGACNARYGPGCDAECRGVAYRALHPEVPERTSHQVSDERSGK